MKLASPPTPREGGSFSEHGCEDPEKQVAPAAATEAGRGQMHRLGALSSRHPHSRPGLGANLKARGCLERLQADVKGFKPERGILGREGPCPPHARAHTALGVKVSGAQRAPRMEQWLTPPCPSSPQGEGREGAGQHGPGWALGPTDSSPSLSVGCMAWVCGLGAPPQSGRATAVEKITRWRGAASATLSGTQERHKKWRSCYYFTHLKSSR